MLQAEFDPIELPKLPDAGAAMSDDDVVRLTVSEESPEPAADLEIAKAYAG